MVGIAWFGTPRLERGRRGPNGIVERFANYSPPTDDRTMVVIQVS